MKSMKKFAGMLLALVMVLAMAVPVFAAGNGTITVSNPIKGQTYTAYKIFDVKYSTEKDAYSYTIDQGSPWYEVVNAYTNKGITLTKVGTSTTYVVTMGNSFSAADFANELKKNMAGKTGTTLTIAKDGDPAVASGLDLGYYFVSSTSGALCNLTTTDPEATIHDKNDMPFEKTDDKADVQVGETVSYTITGKVPDTTGFKTYDYIIEDTMSAGLTFNGDMKDVTLTIDGETITLVAAGSADASTAKATYEKVGNGFKLEINVMHNEVKAKVGQEIKVTYSAVVNEQAIAKVSKNEAKLTYSNDPTNSEKKTTTPPVKETVYSSKIVVNKYDARDKGKKLAGATFVLMNEAKNAYYHFDTVNKKVEWVTDIAQADQLTTKDEGMVEFGGLKNGMYYLKETAAPAGYNPLTSEVEITVNGSQATEENVTSLTVKEDVANSTGGTLPETGGIGTTILYVTGGVLMVGAAVLLITKKRMKSEK